jgi:hypothetical protein
MRTHRSAAQKPRNLTLVEQVMSNRHRKLRMEQMEAREMMAGDVTASVSNGTLYINEAGGQSGRDNSVLISQIAPGKIRVAGNPTTTDSSVSKVFDGNHHSKTPVAFVDFNVSCGLVVKLGGGSDLVIFDQSAPPTFTDVNIDLAAPPIVAQPAAVLNGVVAPPIMPADKDNLIMWGATINGSLTVNTGGDSDWVYIANTPITGNVTINTGVGADTAQLQNLPGTVGGAIDIQLYSSLAEKDADVAWLDHVYANGNINVRGGDGADLIHLDNVTSYKDFNLDVGAGDDKVEINDVCAVDNFFANLGDGNDAITVNDLYVINKTAKIDGGAGSDSITKTGALPTTQLKQAGFEWVNGRPVLVIAQPIGAVMAKA